MAPHFRASAFLGPDDGADDYPVAERPSILGYRQTISLRRSYAPTKPMGMSMGMHNYNTNSYMRGSVMQPQQPRPSAAYVDARSPRFFGAQVATPPHATQQQQQRQREDPTRRCISELFGEEEEEKEERESATAETESYVEPEAERETDGATTDRDDSDDDYNTNTANTADSIANANDPDTLPPTSAGAIAAAPWSNIPMLPIGDMPLLDASDDEEEQEPDLILCDPTRLTRTNFIDEDGYRLDRHSILAPNMNVMPRESDFMLELRPGSVIKSGLLFRQGFSFRRGGWKVRYVELTSTHMTFFTEENGRQRGQIALTECSTKSIEIMPRDSLFDGAQATMWRFAFRAKGKRILLAAYTEADMKEWLRCLHVALNVQHAGAGRFTDLVVPNGTLLATREDGQMRSSGSQLRWWRGSSVSRSFLHPLSASDDKP